MLRKHGVVGKFVEFFGDGLRHLPLADRATIGNMSPEYGATCGIFPVDSEALRYLRLSGRSEEQVALVEAYAKAQGMWHEPVQPSLAGPKRPQDRVLLEDMKQNFNDNVGPLTAQRERSRDQQVDRFEKEGGGQPQAERLAAKPVSTICIDDCEHEVTDGTVVI